MTAKKTRKRALFLDTEAAHQIDPSASGAGYTWVPCIAEGGLGMLKDLKQPIPTNYMTGRGQGATKPIPGVARWEFDCKIPFWGLAAAAAAGAPGADDVLDQILTHIYGTQVLVNGGGVGVGSAAGTLVLEAPLGSLQDLVPVFESGVPSAANLGQRTQWAKLTDVSGAPTYNVAPNWTTAPTTAAIAYGRKIYRYDDEDGGGTLAFVYRKADQDYTLLGGRCTRAVIEMVAGQVITISLTFRGTKKTAETKGSLPSVGSAPPATPIKAISSPLWFAGTRYPCSKITIDLRVEASQVEGTEGDEGVIGDETNAIMPLITANPKTADAITALKHAATSGQLLIQMGGGVVSGGVLDGGCFEAGECTIIDEPDEDENGRLRQSVQIEVNDAVEFAAGVPAVVHQLARA